MPDHASSSCRPVGLVQARRSRVIRDCKGITVEGMDTGQAVSSSTVVTVVTVLNAMYVIRHGGAQGFG